MFGCSFITLETQWHYLFCCQTHLGSCEGAAVEHSGTRPSLTSFVPNWAQQRQNHRLVRTPAHWKRQRQRIISHKCNVCSYRQLLDSLVFTVGEDIHVSSFQYVSSKFLINKDKQKIRTESRG